MADPTQIHQIMMNLGTNAYQAMRQSSGILAVELSQVIIDKDDSRVGGLHLLPGPHLLLKVSDTGVGMGRATIDRIFDPYFTTRGDGGGTGMGLAVVHGIVKEHEGHISVYSEPGCGTSFNIYFPQISSLVTSELEVQRQIVQRGTERILLIEDEEIVMRLEKAMLEELGYQVTTCSCPLDALTVIDKRPEDFDLVLTDMTMPKMNGAELIRKILKKQPEMPIILCTGFSELVNEEKALALGAKQYIMKPLIRREIAAVIRNVLDDVSGKT